MKRFASPLAIATGLLVLMMAFAAGSSSEAMGPPSASHDAHLDPITAPEDLVTLERRFDEVRGVCAGDAGVPTNRVFPDGTRELFTVPAGRALVITDLQGDIVKKANVAWFVGGIAVLRAVVTGALATYDVPARVQLTQDAVTAGIATMQLHLESGVVADPGAAVCLRAFVRTKNGVYSSDVGTDVRVYGYLINR
jgi:hypothetical protein